MFQNVTTEIIALIAACKFLVLSSWRASFRVEGSLANVGPGDPNSNWAWFEKQKKAHVRLRIRFSSGHPDNVDGLRDDYATFVQASWKKLGPSTSQWNLTILLSIFFPAAQPCFHFHLTHHLENLLHRLPIFISNSLL
jgi:hypothetical protein